MGRKKFSFRSLKLQWAIDALRAIGVNSIPTIAETNAGESVKYGDYTVGQIEAILNRVLAGVPPERQKQVIAEILSGTNVVNVEQLSVFDHYGRYNTRHMPPLVGPITKVLEYPERHFLKVPNSHYDWILSSMRKIESMSKKTFDGDSINSIKPERFEKETWRIYHSIHDDPYLRNMTAANFLPIVFPKIISSYYGGIIFELTRILYAQHKEAYPDRDFDCSSFNPLDPRNKMIPQSDACKELLERMSKGPVVAAIMFPFQGISPQACREIFNSPNHRKWLPENAILAGGIETLIAFSLYAEDFFYENPKDDGDKYSEYLRSYRVAAAGTMFEDQSLNDQCITVGVCGGGRASMELGRTAQNDALTNCMVVCF